jgi:putative FmdB family regulatory protein
MVRMGRWLQSSGVPATTAGAHSCPRTGFVVQTAYECDHAAAVPTYDYQCRSCGSVTEVIHSMLEEGPSVCERCGGELRRVLYPTGIIFKGSGFYRTDSRDGGSAPKPSTTSTSDPAPSSETKPKASSAEGTKGSGDSGS